MPYLVFDIETIGKQYDELDETSQAFLRQWAERDANSEEEIAKSLEQIKKGLPFSPFLGEIVAIGMVDDQDQGAVYFRADNNKKVKDFEEDGIQYRVGTEKEILEKFWEVAKNFYTFATFNGRGFDGPFLMIRSAVHGMRPSRNIMPPRYLSQQKYGPQHIDLADQLAYYGSIRRSSLHFTTKAFGIESPKGGEVSGEEVPQAFKDGKYEEIARYCMDDVFATKKLYEYWNKYLNFELSNN
jgi:3'-5' exonuclease